MGNKSEVKMNLKPSVSDEIYTTSYSMHSADSNSEKFVDPGTTFEVFRNNTTAVEVIVKEVPNKSKKNKICTETTNSLNEKKPDQKYESMVEELQQLRAEINRVNKKYLTAKRDLRQLVFELRKQFDVICQRELEEQTKNLTLQLENQKLQTMIDTKTNILNRLMKELNNMKRTLKFVVRGICLVPQVPDNITINSDIDYDDFEKGLKKESQGKFAANLEGLAAGICGNTLDSTLPSFDKF